MREVPGQPSAMVKVRRFQRTNHRFSACQAGSTWIRIAYPAALDELKQGDVNCRNGPSLRFAED